jgi:hypothetical protein
LKKQKGFNMEPTLRDEIQALSKRHVAVNGMLLIVFTVLLLGFAYSVHKMTVSYEKNLVRFEESEKDLKAQLDTTKQELKAEIDKREAIEKEKAKVYSRIEYRDRIVEGKVKEVTNPELSIKEVADLSKTNFNLPYDPIIVQTQGLDYIGFLKPDVQVMLETRLRKENAEKQVIDFKELLRLEQEKSTSFAQSANSLELSLNACQKALGDCKKVAGLTKRQKIFGTIKKVGTYALIGFVAYKVGRQTR